MMVAAVILWTLVAVCLALGVWGLFIEPNRLEVTKLTVPLPRLPEALRGLTIGHLSDFHLNGRRGPRRIAEQACEELKRCSPDLICVTGDIINATKYLDEGVAVLEGLQARLGVFVTLGNHDCDATMEDFLYGEPRDETAEQQWKQALADTSLVVLDNEWREVRARGQTIIIVGVGDVSAGRDDFPQALDGAPSGDLRLLLSHSPDALDQPEAEQVDLLLAGHTHGGQVQLPGLGAAWAPVWRLRQRASGLMRLNSTVAFVNRGVGAGIRARINCPPQVALLELVPGSVEHLPQTRPASPTGAAEGCN